MKRLIKIILILAAMSLLSSCGNTAAGFGGFVRGIGTDIEIAATSNSVE